MAASVIDSFLMSLDLLNEEKEAFANILHSKELDKECFLVEEGEISTNIYFIATGAVRMFYVDYDGKEHVKSFNFDGDFIAPYASIIARKASNHYIQCLMKSQFICFDYFEAKKIFEDSVSLLKLELALIQGEYVEKENREYEFLTQSAKERYLNFISIYKEYLDLLPEKYIASYLGVNPSTLSRLKNTV